MSEPKTMTNPDDVMKVGQAATAALAAATLVGLNTSEKNASVATIILVMSLLAFASSEKEGDAFMAKVDEIADVLRKQATMPDCYEAATMIRKKALTKLAMLGAMMEAQRAGKTEH